MPVLITEAVALAAKKSGSGKIRIRIIDEGVGSSGTYPKATLEAAAKDRTFPKGLHLYADHPTALESADRPERTIKDLMGVLESDAVYESGSLYADAKVFPQWREIVTEMADDIGMSIRASAEIDESSGERVITRLVEAQSVDFVTRAGRGGRVMEVLESAKVAQRAVSHGVAEATANQTRELLSRAVKDAHGGNGRYAYVRDFDDTTVWFNASGDLDEESKTWQRGYTLDGTAAALTGEPVEVRAETNYVPVTTPTVESKNSVSDPATVTENGKEPSVATTQIEEAELATLKDNAGRVTALEAENKTLRESAVKVEAAKIVAEAFEGVEAPKTIARLSESYALTEDGTLDAAALKAVAEESAAEWKVAGGAGTVRGLGASDAPEIETTPASARESILAASGYTPKGA